MKNSKRILFMLGFFTALTFAFTSCSKSDSNEDEGDETEAVDDATEDADAADGEAMDGEAAEGDGSEASEGASFGWTAGLNDWIATGSGMTSITLDGIGDEESGITEAGTQQLELIAAILEANEGVNAVIKGHTPADQKIGNGKARAMWTKAKLILGHEAVGTRITTEGVGSNEPIADVDANDASQRRVTVSFSK